MRTRGYRVCLSVPLGRRNGAMVLHEADGKVHGWWEVMAPRNTLSGTVSADGRLTLSGVLRTLISTVPYTVEGTIDGSKLFLTMKTASGAYYSVSGEEFILMTKFYKRIVDHQNLIIAVFLILFAVCAACQSLVAVNYDMNDYLPPESPSTVALDLMDQEYDGGIPNARVMVQDVTIPQALAYKEQLLAVDGVTDVTWLDDVASVTVPLETLDTDTLESYYKTETRCFP